MKETAHYKMIFTGPVGAGKTTAIAALSDVPPVTTEQKASDETAQRKALTTTSLDYGIMRLEGGQSVHLYGTPGQERFDFMWEILAEGGIGLVLLLDAAREAPLNDMIFFLDAFKTLIAETGIAIGLSRVDLIESPDVLRKQMLEELSRRGLTPPLFYVDAREKKDIKTLVRAMLYSIDPGLNHAQ